MSDINQPAPLGFGGTNPAQNAPVPQPAFEASTERLNREKSATTGDYAGSIWRQDGLVDGFVAHLAGEDMAPDPTYNSFTDPRMKELQDKLWPEYKDRLYGAHSPAHALYLQDQLMQKQTDLTRLGDMGWKGNVGRFALNAVMPDQLLIGMAGGRVAQLAKAMKAGTGVAAALGVAGGAGGNAAYEKLRQSVSFEDDSTKVLEAGLLGGFITLPFALRDAQVSGRAAAAASKEHDALQAVMQSEAGVPVTPAQVKSAAELHDAHAAIVEHSQGKIDDAALEARLEKAVPTPAAERIPTPVEELHLEVPTEAPVRPVVASEVPVEGSVAAAPVTPPEAHPAEAFVGRGVSWAGPEGDSIDGVVTSFNKDLGKLIVKTPEGMRAVKLEQLDQHVAGEAPSGFMAEGSVGAGKVARVARSVADQTTAMSKARFDIFASLNASPVSGVRELAYRLVKDAIGNDAHEAQAMTASEWKKQVQRQHAGAFHKDAGMAYDEAVKAAQVPIWGRGAFKKEFYDNVSRVTRGDAQVLADNPTIAASLQKASGAQKTFFSNMLEELKAAGVKGAEGIDANDFHVNRVWHPTKMRDAEQLHGKQAVHDLIASSISRKQEVIDRYRLSPGNAALTDAEILAKKAKGFYNTVKSLEFNPALREIQLAGRDMGTLRRELADMGVKDHQIDDLVDFMFEVRPSEGDAGRAANLKFRFGLDETSRIKTQAGELRLADLWENDSRMLVDIYGNSMGGHVGLAKAGIDSQASWAQELKRVADEAMAGDHNGSHVAKDMKLLGDIHSNILGRPMSTSDFSGTARAAAAFRGYTRGVMLPQLGIAAAFEMSKAVSMFGFRTMMKQMPSLRGFVTAIRKGYIPDEGLARQIQVITGFGNEKVSAYHRMQEIESGYFGHTLTSIESGSNRVSHAVDVMSGNASFTSMTKQLSGMMATQQLSEYAQGLRKLTPKMSERWTHQGLGTDDVQPMFEALNKHSTTEGGVVKEIRYEDWKADSPKTYEKYQTFMSRQVRDAIQDHDLGETMPFMHSTLGKVFAELKTFMLVAHAKNFLKQLHYHDAAAAQLWAISFLGEALAYSTQSAINYPGDLQAKLQPDLIAKAAFFRMSAMGTASMIAESGYNILSGGESLVQPGMTTNTDNRSIFNTPSLIVAKRMGSGLQTLAGMANPTSMTTRSEAKDLLGAIPGANLYGIKAAGQYWANSFPKMDPAHPMAGR